MKHQPWEHFLPIVAKYNEDKLLKKTIRVLGEGLTGYILGRAGRNKNDLLKASTDYPVLKSRLQLAVTTISFLQQIMDDGEIKTWFTTQRSDQKDFSISDLIREDSENKVLDVIESEAELLALSA